MSNTTIALRASGATGNVPSALDLAYGEFALNYADGIIYYRTDNDTIGSILNAQPSGLDTEVQFNDLGSFGSSANLSFNKSTGQLSTTRIYVAANAQIVGNVTANRLISNNSVGSAGGDILLAMPSANNTLSGLGITIDAFENKIRFFEQGGTNRGAYIDLTEASANGGTNLLSGGLGANNVLQYRSSYTANGGQTVFAATYIPNYVDVFLNGVYLTPAVDFTATNGTTITLSEAAVSNDSVIIIGYVTVATTLPDAIQHRYSYTANSAQTTFAAVYVAPYIDVYKNGSRLSLNDDFTANNGTDVVLTTGAALDDLIEIVGYSSYTATVVEADQLTTGRTIGMTGDVTWTSNSFNGTANVTGTSSLANTGVTAGTYTKVTVDAKGRVTTGNTLSSSDIPTLNQNTTGNAATATTANNVSGGTANVTTLTTSSTVTLNGGTATGVAFLNGSKVLTTGSEMTFNGTTLVVSDLTDSSLTSGRITYAGTSGNLVDSANLTFNGTTLTTQGLIVSRASTVVSPEFRSTVLASSSYDKVTHGLVANYGLAGQRKFEFGLIFFSGLGGPTAFLGMPQANGTGRYLWLDNNGKLRSDTEVTSIGTTNGTVFLDGGGGSITGSLGIGTSSPGANLHVITTSAGGISTPLLLSNASSVDGSGAQISFNTLLDNFTVTGSISNVRDGSGAYSLRFSTYGGGSSSERMRINSSGNVGIGTSSPLSKLTVLAPSTTNPDTVELRGYRNFTAETYGATAILAVSNNTRNAHDFGAIRFEQNPATGDGGGALVRFFAGGSSSSFPTSAEFLRGTIINSGAGVNNIQLRTADVERVRIDSSGNVGIGTSSPLQMLQVAGNVLASNLYFGAATGSAGTIASDSGSSGGRISLWGSTSAGAGLIQIATAAAAPITFTTSGTERVRISAAGRVTVGSTGATFSNSFLAANEGFTAYGTFPVFQTYNSAAATDKKFWRMVGGSTGNLTFETVNDTYTAATTRFTVLSTGGIAVVYDGGASGAVGQSFRPALDDGYPLFFFNAANSPVGAVRTFVSSTSYLTSSDYRLKENVQPMTGALAKVAALKPCTYNWRVDGSEGQGFIAHELAEICPQAVSGEKDAVDVEGKPQYQGIDTSFLVATLTAAIQELKAEFDAYKSTHP